MPINGMTLYGRNQRAQNFNAIWSNAEIHLINHAAEHKTWLEENFGMNRPMKRSVGKLEALDFAAGTYSTRAVKRERYSQHDFLEYLNTIEMMDYTQNFDEEAWE